MHATLYIGTYEAVIETLPNAVRGTVDVYHLRGGLCTVKDAEELCRYAARAPIGSVTHLVVAYDRFMAQAQNMLLKSIEDSTHVRWYFIVERQDILLPTIRSRLSSENISNTKDSCVNASDEATPFLTMSYAKRLAYITAMYAKTSKSDEEKTITHKHAQNLVTACEYKAHYDPVKYVQLAKDTLFVRKYLDQPGASPKMLLELLAMSL